MFVSGRRVNLDGVVPAAFDRPDHYGSAPAACTFDPAFRIHVSGHLCGTVHAVPRIYRPLIAFQFISLSPNMLPAMRCKKSPSLPVNLHYQYPKLCGLLGPLTVSFLTVTVCFASSAVRKSRPAFTQVPPPPRKRILYSPPYSESISTGLTLCPLSTINAWSPFLNSVLHPVAIIFPFRADLSPVYHLLRMPFRDRISNAASA